MAGQVNGCANRIPLPADASRTAAKRERMMERIWRRLYRSTFAGRARRLSSKQGRINDMKKRSIILGTAGLLAVLLAVPFAYAQHRRVHGMAMMHGGPGGELG